MFGVFRLIIMGFSLQHRGLHQQIHQLLMDQFKFIPYQFKVEQQCLMRAKLRTKAKDPK
nr:hypothetical protein Q903MT_gene3580 [Picea sitchensis]